MDTFKETMEKIQQMPAEEQGKVISMAKTRCTCPACPTYGDCMKGKQEILYCITGKSACTVTKKACLCPTCPVTPMMGLSHGYYCARGSEKEIRGLP
ncbi:MAG: DUF2769 domain-containing protein [Methanomicrobiales archaeon]|nr:DUF2769 domain-containing protein [Methanomicrobiales archaeon]